MNTKKNLGISAFFYGWCAQYRKIFLLITNELEINNNLLGRPSRIRYVRSFGNLPEETTLELLNDILIDKDAIEPVLDLIRQMQIVTVC